METRTMTIAETILSQLGGNKFLAMTGAKNLIDTGDGLRMTLPRNMSKANRLEITLDYSADAYNMRFYRYSPAHADHRRMTWVDEKVTEVKAFNGVYFDMLQELFTEVTGFDTHL